jgi:hypothetical protein
MTKRVPYYQGEGAPKPPLVGLFHTYRNTWIAIAENETDYLWFNGQWAKDKLATWDPVTLPTELAEMIAVLRLTCEGGPYGEYYRGNFTESYKLNDLGVSIVQKHTTEKL